MTRILFAIALVVIATSSALAFGLGREGARGGFGALGSMGKSVSVAPATPCSGTGLIFTSACNSQYIGIL